MSGRWLWEALTGASGKRYGRWGTESEAGRRGGPKRGGVRARTGARQSMPPATADALSALSVRNPELARVLSDPEDVHGQAGAERQPPGPHQVIWRYRRELAPLLAAALLTGVAQWGHADHPTAWPWALVIGIVATAAWWWRRAQRPPAPAYVLTVGALATLWLVVAWLAGPWHRWLLVPLLSGALLAGVPWWDHQLPRPGLEAKDDGAPAEMRERVAALIRHWPHVAAAQGLGGVRIQPPVVVDRHGWQWRLRLPTLSRLTGRELIAAAPRLDKVFRVLAGGTRLELDSGRADRLLLRVNVSNPLGEPMPYEPPVEPRSIAEPARPGRFEDRAPVEVVLARHLLGVGRSGSGKSTLQEVLLYELLASRDAVVWAVDLGKRGVRFRDLEPALGWLALEAADARAMFEALTGIQDARARWMVEAGLKRWPLSPERPQLVVLVDEYTDLMAQDGLDELAAEVARKGREQAIALHVWTQHDTAKELGGSVFVKRQAVARIALQMDAPAVDLVLDQGAHAAGFRPELFRDEGMFYLRTPELRTPRPARGFLPADDQGVRIAELWAPLRPRLEAGALEIAERHRQAAGRGGPTGAPADATQARLLELLDQAPPPGVSLAELERLMAGTAGRRWLVGKLAELRAQGRAVRVQRGRWRGAGGDGRPELVVIHGQDDE